MLANSSKDHFTLKILLRDEFASPALLAAAFDDGMIESVGEAGVEVRAFSNFGRAGWSFGEGSWEGECV
jgi:hypothetical protein